MRERIAYLFMVGIMIILLAVVFGVLGKGEYKTPPPEEQKPPTPKSEGPKQGYIVSPIVKL